MVAARNVRFPSHTKRTPRGSIHRPNRQMGVNGPGPESGEMGPF